MPRFIVAQIGARMHYAVPRILNEADALARLYTDICATRGWPKLCRLIPNRVRPAGIRRLLDRVPVGIKPDKITHFPFFAIGLERKSRLARTEAKLQAVVTAGDRRFCELVIRHGLHEGQAIYAFSPAALEILIEARRLGLKTVLEQTIAPRRVMHRLLAAEREKFPQWVHPADRQQQDISHLAQREETEWTYADQIICGSEFVRQGISSVGGPADRCTVVPYGVELSERQLTEMKVRLGQWKGRPLRVLTVGTVGLRKGSPYVLEAARRLKGLAQFRMVGMLRIPQSICDQLRGELELTGPVPRSEVNAHYDWADVFLLPSICEGSATVTYEAMARGLPIICTPNTGSIVRNGIDGWIVPAGDVQAIVNRLTQMIQEPDCLVGGPINPEITLQAYRQRLLAALGIA